eukprot:6639037-Pyramimonas_sp.AAC.1
MPSREKLSATGMSGLLRAVGYTPRACNSISGVTDIVQEMPHRDALAFIGAQRRSTGQQREGSNMIDDENWTLGRGRGTSEFANASRVSRFRFAQAVVA